MSSADKWHCLFIFDVDQVLGFDVEIRRGDFRVRVRILKYFFQIFVCVRIYTSTRLCYVRWTRFLKLYERGGGGIVVYELQRLFIRSNLIYVLQRAPELEILDNIGYTAVYHHSLFTWLSGKKAFMSYSTLSYSK